MHIYRCFLSSLAGPLLCYARTLFDVVSSACSNWVQCRTYAMFLVSCPPQLEPVSLPGNVYRAMCAEKRWTNSDNLRNALNVSKLVCL